MRKKKKKDKSGLWFTVVIALLMLTSTIGYVFKGGSGNKYNGFSFSMTEDGRWITKINGRNMRFYYHPSNLENINISSNIIDKIKNSNMVYVAYNPDNPHRSEIAAINLQFSELLWNDFKTYSEKGLTSENEFNIQIINCSNATTANPVIYYKESNNTGIDMEDNCISVEGKTGTDFYVLNERIIYGLYGVIE
jgi:hypothetical protein